MKTTHIQTIRERVVASQPSILDLVFGCEFLSPKGLKTKVTVLKHSDCDYYRVENTLDIAFYSDAVSEDGRKIRRNSASEELWEILGRPIRLADVFTTIEKLKVVVYPNGRSHPHNISITTNGMVLNENNMHLFEWNLKEDDLSKQNPETLEFLATLLTTKGDSI